MRKVTVDDVRRAHDLLRSDPQKYLAMCNEHIRQNPDDPNEYFSRHYVWERLGRKDLALDDLNKSLELEEHPLTYEARGNLFRSLGEYRKAIDDFNRVEAMIPDDFVDMWGPLFRADCHARLGNEAAALADCARLADGHWTPGLLGAPRGNKQEVIAEVRRLAAAARVRSG